MKKTIYVLLVLVVIVAGCASRQEVQSEKPEQKAAPADQKKVEKSPAESKAASENVSEKQLAEAQQLLKKLQARIKDVHFDFDKYSLKDDAKPAVKELADILVKHVNLKVAIEGNCDERGTAEYNISLGERRAQAVKEYLVSLGVSSGRIETTSYGKEKPLCSDHNEDCWAKNRRAHMVLN
ncbi:MAG TPA: peptidoglycan-associated lipoprotein Pal [Dissulfurispiraceae bacterium]|nr:peptidoglycan-associated lipoprotein Pal [Dissulfurispiraceae bacterium]